MDHNRIRPLFGAPEHDHIDGAIGYFDWTIIDTLPKGVRRRWALTYDIENRYFYAYLWRSEDDTGPLDIECIISRRMVDFLTSLLPPEELARCTAASLTA